jgi:hypothetical protein
MYLTLILSTACIFLYQYQLSKARLISSSSQQSIVLNEVLQLHQSQLLATKYNRKLQLNLVTTTTAKSTTSTTATSTKHSQSTTRFAKKPLSDNNDISTSNSDFLSRKSTQSPKNNNKQSSLSFVQTKNNTQYTQYSINTTSGHVIISVFYMFYIFFLPYFSILFLYRHSCGICIRFSEDYNSFVGVL